MIKKKSGKPELLVGVADYPCATAAIKNGANALYFGVRGFNMRDLGTNFSAGELNGLMKYLHNNKVKGYLALNTIIFEEELKEVEKVIIAAKKAGIDAVILWDFGVLALAKKHKLKCFMSTQASVANSLSLKEYAKLGIKRVIFARELNLEQIKKAKKVASKIGIEIECFVHGAMCISVSGRCFLSHELFGRSANRGECLQPCRRAYFLDGDLPDFSKKEVHLQGNTVLSAKDLKTIQFIDKIIATGVDSLKIEGRTKPSDYVAIVTKCYREAIDAVAAKKFTPEKVAHWNRELSKAYNREFSEGFFFKTPDDKDITAHQGSRQTQKRVNVGVIEKYYVKPMVAEIKLFDDLKVGDKVLIEGTTTFIEQTIESMEIEHQKIAEGKQGQLVGIKLIDRARPKDKVFVLRERKPNI
ncbi:MAG: U32 family peptidase [archaeon]